MGQTEPALIFWGFGRERKRAKLDPADGVEDF
jgi:hypothetical protein